MKGPPGYHQTGKNKNPVGTSYSYISGTFDRTFINNTGTITTQQFYLDWIPFLENNNWTYIHGICIKGKPSIATSRFSDGWELFLYIDLEKPTGLIKANLLHTNTKLEKGSSRAARFAIPIQGAAKQFAKDRTIVCNGEFQRIPRSQS